MIIDDGLARYRAKRNFALTPEPDSPRAKRSTKASEVRRFVVQKHWASRLHYDFRLELDGTMRSWAVPKGPSLDTQDKRMAVQVEDHPVSYADFEGEIPKKQYGAGKVIVWDKGYWQPLGDPLAGYRAGNLKFELIGHKLKGRWVLVRMKGRGEKQVPWLLIKEKDEEARESAQFSVVDEQPNSVGKLAMPLAPNAGDPEKAFAVIEPIKAALPKTFSPQLATLLEGPPPGPADWLYEIKFDGYRLLTRIDGRSIKLFTRNGHDWSAKLAPVKAAIAKLKLPPGWYDGELVQPDARGRPDFGALQAAFEAGTLKNALLYLFDLPYCEGRDLRALPLHARRARLQELLQNKASPTVRFSEVFDAPAASLVASACKLGLEGLIAKRRDASYVSKRSADWLKLKCRQRQEFVIGGYTAPAGQRSGLGALLLGIHDEKGVLQYVGKVGTGFDDRTLTAMQKQLAKHAVANGPFAMAEGLSRKAHWVEPRLVAEVSFSNWTAGGKVRDAVYHGLRADKPASAIVREKAMRAVATTDEPDGKAGRAVKPLTQRLRITHPERVIDARSGVTKLDLLRYYDLVGELMMVHLVHRPVSLVRAPSGVGGAMFFQKHAESQPLAGIRQLDPRIDPDHPPLLEVNQKNGLLSAAQWNVIELHTRNASANSYNHPDRIVFDIDPGEGVAWRAVQEAAQLLKGFLEELGLVSFLKTSGGKGLHVVVPIRRTQSWDAVKGFSKDVVTHLSRVIPKRFVAKSGPKNRVGLIFIDYLRNGESATTVAAWSARARPGMGISVPVRWDELPSLTGGDHWTLSAVQQRLAEGNEPWKDYAKKARDVSPAIRRLTSALKAD